MITLDELNEYMVVASDAEQDGRHEVARKLRDEAWTRFGVEPSGDPVHDLSRMSAHILDAALRGVIARGYTSKHCMVYRFQDRPGVAQLVFYQEGWPPPMIVVDVFAGFCNPGPAGLASPVMHGVRWTGPIWPPWKIDSSESEAWLAEWTERADTLVGTWLEQL